MHTLEVTLVLCIMFGSIAAVATWDLAPTNQVYLDELLEQRAQEQLAVWADQPGTGAPCAPRTQLESLAFDGLADDHAAWEIRERSFGLATRSDLVMVNGEGMYTLHGPGDIIGASRDVWWSPEQEFAMPLATTSASSGMEHLIVDSPAVQWGIGARLEAEGIRYSADLAGAIGENSLIRWAPTATVSSVHAAPRLVWVNIQGDPELVQVFRPNDVGDRTLVLRLRIDHADEGILNAGSVVHVSTPRDWALTPDWSDVAWVMTSAFGSFRFESAQSVPTPSVLELRMTIPVTAGRPPDVVRAHLTGGALSESNLVVTYPASTERNLPRYIEATTPYPVAHGAWTTLGGVVVNGGDSISVDTFRIQIPGGYDLDHNGGEGAPLFAEISPEPPGDPFAEPDPEHLLNEPATGWELSSDGREIVWTGTPIEIEPFRAQSWYVRVRITDDPRVTTAIEPAWSNGPNATLLFSNGYSITSDQWGKSPGVVRFRVPPASVPMDDLGEPGGSADGYPWKSAPLPGDEEPVLLWANSTLAHLTNATSYRLQLASSDFVSFEHAAANASLQVEDRRAPVGNIAWVTGDVSSLMSTLSENGVESTLAVELYAPPSMGCKPTRTWNIASAALPAGSVTANLVWDGATGLPGVFTATEDGFVHLTDQLGTRVWGTGTTGSPTLLEPMAPAAGDAQVLAGTTIGDVQSIRASDGDLRWTSSVVAGGGSSTAETTALRYHAAKGLVLAGGALGDLVAFDEDGDRVADESLVGSVLEIVPEGDGAFVLTSEGLYRFADVATLEVSAHRTLLGVGMARGSSHVLLAHSDRVALVDPLSLAETSAIPLDTAAQLASRGDVTGDGHEDLALGRASLRLSVIDGVTEALLPQFEHDLSDAFFDNFELRQPPDIAYPATPGDDVCNTGEGVLSYHAQVSCAAATERFVEVHAGEGILAIAYVEEETNVVRTFGASGAETWHEGLVHLPGALASGPWVAGQAVAFGDSAGALVVHEPESGVEMRSTPSQRVGAFRLPIPVPQGGFYGTHLVVARLRWSAGPGELQEARLVDWFDAVSMTGDRVIRPSYRIALTLEELDEPFALRPGEV